MRLVRYGLAGAEAPGMMDEAGRIRELSRVIKDIGGEALLPQSIDRTQAPALLS